MNWKNEPEHGNSGPCSVIIMSEALYLVELCFGMCRVGLWISSTPRVAAWLEAVCDCVTGGGVHVSHTHRAISLTMICIYFLAHRWCSRKPQCAPAQLTVNLEALAQDCGERKVLSPFCFFNNSPDNELASSPVPLTTRSAYANPAVYILEHQLTMQLLCQWWSEMHLQSDTWNCPVSSNDILIQEL